MLTHADNTTPTPFSNDIKLLGNLLGYIIREQHGEEALALVEDIRAIAKARRSGDEGATQTLMAKIEACDLEAKQILIKAFGNYFQLINIAEDQQRIRVLRERESRGTLIESIQTAIRNLKERGMSAKEMRALLQELRLRFVLTAHPSEAKRTEVLVKLRQIAHMMDTQERVRLLPREMRQIEAQLSEEIEELWQTRAVRASQKKVSDEVQFGMYFVTSVIMDVVVDIYADIYDTLEEHYPEEDWSNLHRLLRFGSWIGGDRDGNPNVTSEITLQTLQSLRDKAREVYLQDLSVLQDHLTQNTDAIANADKLNAAFPASAGTAFEGERYREIVAHIRERLGRDGYRSRLPLLDDLRTLQENLRQNGSRRVAEGKLRNLIRKVRLFGLYLTPLDIREDSRLMAQTLDELFRHYGMVENYLTLTEGEKQAILNHEITNPRPLFPLDTATFSETAQKVIAMWRMIATAHKRFSVGVIDTIIASMSQSPSDVLTMYLMAKEVGVEADLDIVPLFETIDDLENAPRVVETLFRNPHYMAHLKKRKMRQQIMIGYSDSGKDGGYIASNWHLYTAQDVLAETCERYGVSLELFHGRGGSIGRGGGPTNRAILSQPPTSLKGGIKITEQGEVIAYRYSNHHIARRHFHQVLNAVILSLGNASNAVVKPEWSQAMGELSELGRVAYRQFVYEQDGFLEFWQQATPINELSQLRISSRPARRGDKGGFSAMRAIPWVFSWMQNRAIIPSWYGIGTAFNAFCEANTGNLGLLQRMYQEWLFFKALIENAQLDVAKADMGILELYASLVKDRQLADDMFGRIREEHELTQRMICAIIGQEELLDNTPSMKHSIERRNPYVDPLNFLQVALLRQLRSTPTDAPEYQEVLDAVLATINGIAAGMKTTG
jgi:phosphoenolpyruvate carboxylase